jgi:hypothetical protein
MADYKDPWAWMQGEQVPKTSNALPPVPQMQAPANITGGGPGMLTNMAVSKGVTKGSEAAYDYGKGAYDSYIASQPSNVGTATPVQGPTTGTEALQAKPLSPLAEPTAPVSASTTPTAPLSAPVEPATTTAAAEGAEIAGSAKAATDTATAAKGTTDAITAAKATSDAVALAEAAEASGLAVQTAGLTAAQIEALLLQQAAQAAAAQQAAAYTAVVLVP